MNTTISIPVEVRDELKDFGTKGETYEEILRRLLKSAKQRQLQELLMDEKGTVPAREALERARKAWQR
jgi:predicted CopG family antitoxin